MELFVVLKIFSPIANQKVKTAKTTYKHLVNLTLAENSLTNEKLNVKILIGSDFYWKFFNVNVINANEGPVAMKTGWVLRGRVTTDYTNNNAVENVSKITTDPTNPKTNS